MKGGEGPAFAIVAILAVAGAASANEIVTYTYDARGRLVAVERTETVNDKVKAEYRYDRADNRISVDVTVPNRQPGMPH